MRSVSEIPRRRREVLRAWLSDGSGSEKGAGSKMWLAPCSVVLSSERTWGGKMSLCLVMLSLS